MRCSAFRGVAQATSRPARPARTAEGTAGIRGRGGHPRVRRAYQGAAGIRGRGGHPRARRAPDGAADIRRRGRARRRRRGVSGGRRRGRAARRRPGRVRASDAGAAPGSHRRRARDRQTRTMPLAVTAGSCEAKPDATELGDLLHQHPDRVQRVVLPAGAAPSSPVAPARVHGGGCPRWTGSSSASTGLPRSSSRPRTPTTTPATRGWRPVGRATRLTASNGAVASSRPGARGSRGPTAVASSCAASATPIPSAAPRTSWRSCAATRSVRPGPGR